MALVLAVSAPAGAEAQRRYTVRAGDTLVEIAHRFGVGVATLQRANRMNDATIRPGEKLRIPGRSRGSARGRRSGRRYFSGVHTVRPGDTLSGIARRYDVSIRRIQRANRLSSPMIRPGDRLRIPGRGMGRQRPQGARPDELTEEQKAATERAEQLGLGSSKTAHHLLTDPPEPEWVEAAGEPEGLESLLAPIEEPTILRGWGSGAGGYHLAIDFGAEPDTEVRAAARGIVAYAGNQVRGYGNIVIVVHPNGWVTWYTHNRQNRVVAGQRVERGEVLGTVGATGYARGAHLHFMLVHEGEHCDPMPLLRSEQPLEDRTGDVLERERVTWADGPPDGVRCLPKSARPHPRSRRRRRHRRGR